MENVAAITFDVGGTLIEPWPSVGHAYAEVAARHGVHAAPEEIAHRFVEAWRQRGEFEYTKGGWAVLVDATFAGLTTILPSQSFFDELYYDFGTSKPWRIFDDVLPTITALREQGTRLAVISNWDDRLCPLLETLELAREFEVILVSAEVGHTKPAPEIFQAAAEALRLPSSEILHVGDSENEDHHGAQTAGFQSRWLCRDSAEPIGHSIPSLMDLL
ncbi:MAG: HAD-IA family hydrolase [Verrucomicrobiales bacterium]|nr:HAD-IA family hydrolase [Verrucomicrobiales bacterium]